MAGESPDRSKQQGSSAETTTGSGAPVPEPAGAARDPRLTMTGEKAGVDQPTAVFSTRALRDFAGSAADEADPPSGGAAKSGKGAGDDTALRASLASWVRSAEENETGSAAEGGDATSSKSGAAYESSGAASDGDARDAASGEAAGEASKQTAGASSVTAAEKPAEKGSEEADGAEGSAKGEEADGAEPVDSAADAEDAPKAEDAPESEEAPESAIEAEGDPKAEAGAEGTSKAGTEAEGDSKAGPESEGDPKADSEAEGGPKVETEVEGDSKAEAGAEGTSKAGTEAEGDSKAGPESEGDPKDETEAEGDPKVETEVEGDSKAEAGAEGTPKAGTEAEGDSKAGPESEGDPKAETEAEGDPKVETEVEGDSKAEAGAEGTPKAGTEAEGDSKAGTESEGDPKADSEAEGGPKDETEAEDDPKDDPKDETGVEDGPTDSKASVDKPTAVFKVRQPAVDQPTTVLKLREPKPSDETADKSARKPGPSWAAKSPAAGTADKPDASASDKPAPAAKSASGSDAGPFDTERTSKFVALKSLDESAPAKPKPAAGPAEATTALPQVGPERTTQQPLPPKPPMDLLAELTNTPPPPETPVRSIARRVKIWTPLVLLVAVIIAIVQVVRPLPAPTLTLTAKDTYSFDGDKVKLPWPGEGQGWMDVDGVGTMDHFGEQKPVPIASVAKTMTAYIILRDHPLKPGQEGPKIKIDATAAKEGSYDESGDESTLNTVHAGQFLTEKQALSAVMIPSANNIARLLARWDAGSEEAFVKKMNDTAKELGMTNTTYTDPSGLTKTTVSTAEDQVKLGTAAMRIPAMVAITSVASWTDPSGKYWTNYNELPFKIGAIGLKTGSTTAAGGNLLFAAHKQVGGRTVTIVGAILGQYKPNILETVNAVSKTALLAAKDVPTSAKILKKGDVVGYVDDHLGGHTPVVVTKDVTAVGWAGLTVKLSFTSGEVPHTAKAGTQVGTLTVGDGGADGAVKIPVALQKDLVEPRWTDKLTRLG
ncbi:hypothetical protein [Streptomyces colonosanans]|uniref:serine-type D-Ala-D-Ala carboxypeptidase n=1 Tax=Streptomyces colonosanans TaxID=1428652 RepID=A0A1S2Q660_9ACTN|nr:hypothetical protein [Streptomyces colonosanans]OIK01608.1 hypothetical protein BIV24_00895 [Streptomyces colonosanans]